MQAFWRLSHAPSCIRRTSRSSSTSQRIFSPGFSWMSRLIFRNFFISTWVIILVVAIMFLIHRTGSLHLLYYFITGCLASSFVPQIISPHREACVESGYFQTRRVVYMTQSPSKLPALLPLQRVETCIAYKYTRTFSRSGTKLYKQLP